MPSVLVNYNIAMAVVAKLKVRYNMIDYLFSSFIGEGI
jgi:hypothetical protein